MALTIRTNHHYRNLLYGYELTPKERADFDYIEDDLDSHEFVRYAGRVLALSEAMLTSVSGWDGQWDDTVFSCILVKYSEDGEQVKLGFAYA